MCDSATVLKNGRVTGTARPKETSSLELARMMVGSNIPEIEITPPDLTSSAMLEVRELSAEPFDLHGVILRGISLAVHGGEIVGIAGVSGNGQAELIALISGERTCQQRDAIKICGQACGNMDAGERRDLGVSFVPEERLGRGVVPPHRLQENVVLTGHRRGLTRRGLVDRVKAADLAGQIIKKYSVKAPGVQTVAGSLSGGNLQKFIVGREIELQPKVILISQPTWGVDIGAATFIRQSLVDLSRSGVAVLVVSEELDELLEISDRIHVICKGQISRSFNRGEIDREQVGLLMMTGQDEHACAEGIPS